MAVGKQRRFNLDMPDPGRVLIVSHKSILSDFLNHVQWILFQTLRRPVGIEEILENDLEDEWPLDDDSRLIERVTAEVKGLPLKDTAAVIVLLNAYLNSDSIGILTDHGPDAPSGKLPGPATAASAGNEAVPQASGGAPARDGNPGGSPDAEVGDGPSSSGERDAGHSPVSQEGGVPAVRQIIIPLKHFSSAYFAIKGILHTVGHAYGLNICHEPGCVMSHWSDFPSGDQNPDDIRFCASCRKRLIAAG